LLLSGGVSLWFLDEGPKLRGRKTDSQRPERREKRTGGFRLHGLDN